MPKRRRRRVAFVIRQPGGHVVVKSKDPTDLGALIADVVPAPQWDRRHAGYVVEKHDLPAVLDHLADHRYWVHEASQ